MSNPIRESLLRFAPFREKTIEVEVPAEDGSVTKQTVLLRSPTVEERDRIMLEATAGKTDGSLDAKGLSRSNATAVIVCALDPTTRQPIFTAADLEALVGLPAGSFIDQLSKAAQELMSDASKAARKSPEKQEA